MHAMTKGMMPPDDDLPDEAVALPATAARMPVVIWIHDGPVCVTMLDTPPHVPCGACQCAACRAHDPDRALTWL